MRPIRESHVSPYPANPVELMARDEHITCHQRLFFEPLQKGCPKLVDLRYRFVDILLWLCSYYMIQDIFCQKKYILFDIPPFFWNSIPVQEYSVNTQIVQCFCVKNQ